MKSFLIVAGFFVAVVLLVAFQVSLWNECRETNSFFYCMHVLSR